MTKQLHDAWMSAHVRITKGPFVGREGQVAGISGETKVQVAFSESALQKDRLTFDVSQLERVKDDA